MLALRSRWPLLFVLASVGLAACGENLTGGKTCPELCPDQSVSFRDTILTGAIVIDSNLAGYPPLGSANGGYVLSDYNDHGDTLQTALIVRYDSLPERFDTTSIHKDPDSLKITGIDSASITFSVVARTGSDTLLVTDSVFFDIYDVNVDARDLDTAVVRVLVQPPNVPIATRAVPKDSAQGLIRVPIPNDFLLARILNRERFRVGIRVRSASRVQVKLASLATAEVQLRFKAFAPVDTGPFLVIPNASPARPAPQVEGLSVYPILLKVKPPAAPGLMSVGGLPGVRVFLHFDIPRGIIDSATIVRAQLILRQRSDSGIQDTLQISLLPHVVAADTTIVDLEKLALLIPSSGAVGYPVLASLLIAPRDSGERRLPITAVLRYWQFEKSVGVSLQHSIVLTSSVEGADPRRLLFYGSTAPDSIRPRLEVGFVPRSPFGLP